VLNLSLRSLHSLTLNNGNEAIVSWIIQAGELQIPAPDPPPSSPSPSPPNPPQVPPPSPVPGMPPIYLAPAQPGTVLRELPALTITLRIKETPQSLIEDTNVQTSIINAFEALANCTQTVAVSGTGSSEDGGGGVGGEGSSEQGAATTTQLVRSCIAEFLHQTSQASKTGSTGMVTELPLITVRSV
jgi:hypothetical protein